MGACCNAPMAAINDYYYEDLTPESFRQILADFRAGKHPEPGSYMGPHGVPSPWAARLTLQRPGALRRLQGEEDRENAQRPRARAGARSMTSVWKQPRGQPRALALMFAVAFLANGGIALYVNLTRAQACERPVRGRPRLRADRPRGGVQQLLKLREGR